MNFKEEVLNILIICLLMKIFEILLLGRRQKMLLKKYNKNASTPEDLQKETEEMRKNRTLTTQMEKNYNNMIQQKQIIF